MKSTHASSRLARKAALGIAIAVAGLLASCASPAPPSSAPAAPAVTSPLATSLTTAGGPAWAVVPMGGPAAQDETFWELFTLPAAGTQWRLVTPPGVADNGGMVAAAPGTGQRLDLAFRPSQGLTFSPLALTANAGRTWGTGLLDAAIAAVPDALALRGTVLALLVDGAIDQAATPSARWTAVAAPGAIASSAAGRHCGVTGLTAVTLTPTGAPLAAGSCAHPGVAGIFARTAGTWQAAGPALSGPLAQRPVQVVRLTATATGNIALLRVGSGSSATLLAAWSDDGSQWTLSPPLPAGVSGQVRASGTGAGGTMWVLLANGQAAAVPGPGASWRALPQPPPGTTALAAGPAGTFDTLAVSGSRLTVFRLSPAGTWRQTQVITVPIQYGSSR